LPAFYILKNCIEKCGFVAEEKNVPRIFMAHFFSEVLR
jgi:hypothetical protein